MNETLLEQLLNEDESSSLDFKREQYPFVRANKDQKGEIIKDIIAFANAWRRTDAYILMGVEEVCGDRSIVNGVTKHLDEADLQQLVNSKTNRPIEFSYQAFPFEGKQIGVIRIPVQERPFYLKSKYGRLNKEIVYIRRGSSTDIANIDEIAKIGAMNVTRAKVPTLDLQFADLESWQPVGHKAVVESVVLQLPARSQIPLAGDSNEISFMPVNKNYYREYANFFFIDNMVKPLGFVLHNTSSTLLTNARLLLILPQQGGLRLYSHSELPERPRYRNPFPHETNTYNDLDSEKESIIIEKIEKNYEVWINFYNIQPKARQKSSLLYIGGESDQIIDLEGVVYADNLPNPVCTSLTIAIAADEKPMTLKKLQTTIKKYEEDKWNKVKEELGY